MTQSTTVDEQGAASIISGMTSNIQFITQYGQTFSYLSRFVSYLATLILSIIVLFK